MAISSTMLPASAHAVPATAWRRNCRLEKLKCPAPKGFLDRKTQGCIWELNLSRTRPQFRFPDRLPVQVCSGTNGRVGRHDGHREHLLDPSGCVEDRRCRVALRAEYTVAAAMGVVLANVVFAGKRMLKVTGAFVQRGALWAATLTVMHARRHKNLTFSYRQRVAQKEYASELQS